MPCFWDMQHGRGEPERFTLSKRTLIYFFLSWPALLCRDPCRLPMITALTITRSHVAVRVSGTACSAVLPSTFMDTILLWKLMEVHCFEWSCKCIYWRWTAVPYCSHTAPPPPYITPQRTCRHFARYGRPAHSASIEYSKPYRTSYCILLTITAYGTGTMVQVLQLLEPTKCLRVGEERRIFFGLPFGIPKVCTTLEGWCAGLQERCVQTTQSEMRQRCVLRFAM